MSSSAERSRLDEDGVTRETAGAGDGGDSERVAGGVADRSQAARTSAVRHTVAIDARRLPVAVHDVWQSTPRCYATERRSLLCGDMNARPVPRRRGREV